MIENVVFGAPLIPAGFWLSVMALRYARQWGDLLGHLLFLVGGVVGATGFMILIG